MNSYADEAYYNDVYLAGRAPVIDTAFEYYMRQATLEIQRRIGRNDPARHEEKIKLCCCEVAESIYRYEKNTASGAALVSYSNDGQSGTYDMSRYTTEGHGQEVGAIIRRWLGTTGLLYRRV